MHMCTLHAARACLGARAERIDEGLTYLLTYLPTYLLTCLGARAERIDEGLRAGVPKPVVAE